MQSAHLARLLLTALILVASEALEAAFVKRSDHPFIQVTQLDNGNWLGTGFEGVFLSADHGMTWSAVSFPSQGRPGLGVALRSVAANGLVFVGALDDGIWLSRDQGTNWIFTGPVAQSFGTGVGGMVFNGTDFVTGYGGWPRGLYRWNGTGWDQTLGGNDGISLIAGASGRILAGLYPNGGPNGGILVSDDGGRTWRRTHADYSKMVRLGPTLYAIVDSNGVVRRSDDNGETWQDEGQPVPGALSHWVDVPAAYQEHLYAAAHGSGVWQRQSDLSWTQVLTNSGWCTPYVVGSSLVICSSDGVFEWVDSLGTVAIDTQPRSVDAQLGTTVSFSVVSTNATTFQWIKDGNALPGATNATLTLTNVQLPRIGDYQVVAANGFGSVTSSVATLTIDGVDSGIWKGLVAYYPFDGDAKDGTRGGSDGRLMGGARLAQDYLNSLGNSLAVDGVDGRTSGLYVERPLLDVGQIGYTVSVWFNSDNALKYPQTILNTEPHSAFVIGYNRAPSGSRKLYMFLGDGGSWKISDQRSQNVFPENQWHLLVLVKRGDVFTVFVDGVAEISASLAVTGVKQPLSLWFGSIGSIASGEVFAGKLDNARVYNRALSDTDVAALYASELPQPVGIQIPPQSVQVTAGNPASFTVVATNATTFRWIKDGTLVPGATNATLTLTNVQPPRIGDYQVVAGNGFGSVTSSVATLSIHGVDSGIWKGLVAYYPFDGDAKDYSGMGNDGGLAAGASFSSDSIQGLGAVEIDGINGLNKGVRVPGAVLNSGQEQYTVSIWFKSTQPGKAPSQTLINTDPHAGFTVTYNYDGTRRVSMLLGSGWAWQTSMVYSTNIFPQTQWRMASLVKQGARFLLYVDGRIEGMLEAPVGGWNQALSLWIGSIGPVPWALYPGEVFAGRLDDCRIYNRALSDTDVAALYATELQQPLVADDAVTLPSGATVRIPVTTLLANDSHPLGDRIEVESVSPTSAAGGAVQLRGRFVVYTPPSGGSATDSFTYTARDGFLGRATATVHLTLTPASTAGGDLSLVGMKATPQAVALEFVGVKGRQYQIERSPNTQPPWTPLSTVTADAFGRIRYEDTAPLESAGFYRITWVSGR